MYETAITIAAGLIALVTFGGGIFFLFWRDNKQAVQVADDARKTKELGLLADVHAKALKTDESVDAAIRAMRKQ